MVRIVQILREFSNSNSIMAGLGKISRDTKTKPSSVKSIEANNNKNSWLEKQPAYWCIVEVNNLKCRVKIIHIRRGKYRIIHDSQN